MKQSLVIYVCFFVFGAVFIMGGQVAAASQLSVSAKPKTISPDGDGINDRSKIRVTLPGPGRLRMKISQILSTKRLGQEAPKLEYVLVRNLPPAKGEWKAGDFYDIDWNGTNDSGAVVQNGEYQVRVIFTPQEGGSVVDSSLKINVEVIPVFTDLKFFPDPFSSGKQKASIEFRQTKTAMVGLKIVGQEGVVFHRDLGKQTPKKYFYDWDGKNSYREFVKEGQYMVVLTATTRDGRKVEKTTRFNVRANLEIEAISATPRIFDPKDAGGHFATQIRFEVEKKEVDYMVTVQDESGRTVWRQQFNHKKETTLPGPTAKSAKGEKIEKEFFWGGIQSYEFYGEYVVSRKVISRKISSKKMISKREVEKGEMEEEVAARIPIELPSKKTIILSHDLLLYDESGRVDEKKLLKLLKKRKLILSVGDTLEYKDAKWKIDVVNLKHKILYLPNGNYDIRIKVKDPKTQKVSAEFGTEVVILSKVPFKLCIWNVTADLTGSNTLHGDSDDSRHRLMSDLLSQYQTNWCGDMKTNTASDFFIKGGRIYSTLKSDADYFDPDSLRWFTVDKIDPYWVYRDDIINILFRVSKDANISAQVRSDKGGLIKTLPPKKAHLATDEERSFFSWDGTDDEGNFVPSGIYLFDIIATDTDPNSPKTITTTAVINLSDIRKLVNLEVDNVNLRELQTEKGKKLLVADFYAFPGVVPFKKMGGGKMAGSSGLEYLLEEAEARTKSMKLTGKSGNDGALNIILNNQNGKPFSMDYIFATFVPADVSVEKAPGAKADRKGEKVFEMRLVKISHKDSYPVGRDQQQSRISDGFPKLVEPGLLDLWIFAYRKGECEDSGRQGDRERADSILKCYSEKNSIAVKKVKVRGMGHLTETGLHINEVIAAGFKELAKETMKYR